MPKTLENDPSDRKNKSAVPSVEKAFDVIELLSGAPEGMTMNEIVAALDRSMGELYRIVVYLHERGYLDQDPETSKYAMTLKMFELSHRFDPTERMIRNAMPLMERYAATVEQSCHIGVLNRTNVLILASVSSPRPAGYAVRTGAMFPVGQTATALVITAFGTPEDQDRFIARVPTAERSALRARIDHIRDIGYDESESNLVVGIRNLSVPVFNSRGIVAALTSGYIDQPDQVASPQEALAQIRGAAQQLSQSLGYPAASQSF